MRLVLLDRDGVLNEDRADYVKTPGELVLIPGAAKGLAILNKAGLKTALVSNQSVVGRGVVTASSAERIGAALIERLSREGARVDLALMCFDAPWAASQMRKPNPGMLLEAMRHFRAPPNECVMIGDQLTDLLAAKAANVARILVRTGKGAQTQAQGFSHDILPVAVYDSLLDAALALTASAAGQE
jgi:D-glycero-D-manno-heptose 1,7-bisphosphate phosphatase